jgi:hypothetical protein
MPVSSLVLCLSTDPALRHGALRSLEAHPRFSQGGVSGRLVPIALDTPSEAENKRCWRWLNELVGVDFIEVLSVCFTPAMDRS